MKKTDIDPDELDRGAKCEDCGEKSYAGSKVCPECGSENMDTEWNSLLNNYDKHDWGEAHLKGRIKQRGLQIEDWGIDQRHDDGGLIFDNKMDLRLWEAQNGQSFLPDTINAGYGNTTLQQTYPSFSLGDDFSQFEWELKGIGDVKTKSSSSWLGKFNLRHLAHYAQHAAAYDVPVFVYFTLIDEDNESVGEEEYIGEVPTDWNYEAVAAHFDGDEMLYEETKEAVLESDAIYSAFKAFDGNTVIEMDPDHLQDPTEYLENL